MIVAFDTETYLIAPGRVVPRLVCGSFAVGDAVDVLDARDTVSAFWSYVTDPGVILVGHHVGFDLPVIAHAADRFPGPWSGGAMIAAILRAADEGRIRDTMIRAILVAIAEDTLDFDPRTGRPPSFSLAGVVARYLRIDISAEKSDGWRLRFAELDGLPVDQYPADAVEYAAGDALLTLQVHDVIPTQAPRDVLAPDGGIVDEAPQVAAEIALALLSAWGVRTDGATVDAWAARVEREVARGLEVGRAAGFVRADGTVDTAALRARVEAAYRARGAEPGRTPKGATSTDRDTLEGSGDPALLEYAAAGFAKKEATTYLEPARAGVQHPISARYSTLVATGRTSCSKPNLQNPPRAGGYRECFVPRPGFLFCSVDFDTAELRALAQIHLWWFKRSAMADAIRAGRDLHLDLAADMLGITYAEIVARKGEKQIKTARQLAKIANFGFPGGLSARSFTDYARGYGVILHEHEPHEGHPSAHALRDAWLTKWPEMREYFAEISNLTRYGPAAVRQEFSGRVRGGVGYTQACNGFFQGLVADWSKAALWAVCVASYTGRDVSPGGPGWDEHPPGGFSPLYGCRPVLFLHDEIIAEVPEHRADACAREMARVMVAAAQPYAPDVPITASPALMRRWYKGAEPVYNAHGLLIPWTPEQK